MGKLDAPYLITHENKNGSQRHYFAPRQDDRVHGWATVRLHDAAGAPIRDPLKAAEACKAVAAIYTAWRGGEPGMGPHLIDKLGRVVAKKADKAAPVPATKKASNATSAYRPGQVGAMVYDFIGRKEDHSDAHGMWWELADKTRAEYGIYLAILVEKFGRSYWWDITAGAAREWLMERAAAGGPSGAHALYRTCRSFLGKARLLYKQKDHPGIVPEEKNPFLSLNLTLPKSTIILWPRDAVETFVALADQEGQPSIGDAVVMMSWIGIRKQDWLHWPATIFDGDILAFAQEKTDKPLVIPWTIATPLVDRVAAARRRRASQSISARTFFHDGNGHPWGTDRRFRSAFNSLRDKLAKEHPTFATRYYVGLLPEDPLRLPTPLLTVRTLRHTCITFNHDAGITRDLMPAITGHEPKTIDEVLAHYRARTADQAAVALEMREAHERKRGGTA
jgi:integrase